MRFLLLLCLLVNYSQLSFSAEQHNNISFGSLKSNKVNVRAGPSTDYPVAITYEIQALPIKIIAEYDNWYKIVDSEGDGGWIKKYLISNVRTVLVKQDSILYSSYKETSKPLFRVEKNVILKLKKCKQYRCKVSYDKKKVGWIDRDMVWGLEE